MKVVYLMSGLGFGEFLKSSEEKLELALIGKFSDLPLILALRTTFFCFNVTKMAGKQ